MSITLAFIMLIACYWYSLASVDYQEDEKSIFSDLRELYYSSAESEDKLNEAFELINSLAFHDPDVRSKLMVYKGAFVILRAKYSFWPHLKFGYVEDGLEIMKNALGVANEDIESLFIYGTICDNLPFFFGKSDEAQKSFVKIIELLPENYGSYDRDLIIKVVDYLKNNTDLYTGRKEFFENSSLKLLAGNRGTRDE